jgi:phosphoglycerate-specific signal transduction histidine kinase
MRTLVNNLKFNKKAIIYIFLATICLVSACRKRKTQQETTNVPFKPLDTTLYINDPLNFKIQAIGGWIYTKSGVNGLIIYRKSQQEFTAIERTSTALPNNPKSKVYVQNDNFTCKDTVSKSTWQIVDGVLMTGPATLPLKLYATSFDGNALRITSN